MQASDWERRASRGARGPKAAIHTPQGVLQGSRPSIPVQLVSHGGEIPGAKLPSSSPCSQRPRQMERERVWIQGRGLFRRSRRSGKVLRFLQIPGGHWSPQGGGYHYHHQAIESSLKEPLIIHHCS
ncbi:uncharacterized protein LOC112340593 [Selaginella moellendorffii]|uniref:uncharacterized protein LOC112340593 n=1 Tax=Selaginella moellendorffii TaxID=88036 RepID=UPI000D1CB63C|nr:uncharacterized protein LOC112340593 [Selaginella moellendorffii]|eukprot:XP_024515069.1 uncharacterized protein LOC112340593 [Selaginella moellendorffii]